MPFPLIAAALSAAGSLGSALMDKSAVDDAGETARRVAAIQKQAANKAGDKAVEQQKRGLGYLKPYFETGQGGNELLADALGINGPEAQAAYFANFQNDPGFEATQQAGIDAIDQSAAGSGSLRSGGTLKSLFGFGQRGMFGQFQDRLERLKGLSGQGLLAANGMADIRSAMGVNKGNALLAGAGAKVGGMLGSANANFYGRGLLAGATNDLFGRLSGPLSTYLDSSIPGGGDNYASALLGGSGGWTTTVSPNPGNAVL